MSQNADDSAEVERSILDQIEAAERGMRSFVFATNQVLSDIGKFRSNRRISFAIDSVDLRHYLMCGFADPADGNGGDRSIDDYARLDLLRHGAVPVVLLPPYYLEIKDHSRRLATFAKMRHRSARKQVSRVRQRIAHLSRETGLGRTLRDLFPEQSEPEGEQVNDLLKKLNASLITIAQEVSRTERLLWFRNRFESLVSDGRVKSLAELAPQGLKVNKEIRIKAEQTFSQFRKKSNVRPESNSHDADAMALCSAFGRENEELMLFSSAPLTHLVASEVNKEFHAQGVGARIEVRDLSYWKIWMLASWNGNSAVPSGPDVIDTHNELSKLFEDYRAQFAKIRHSLSSNVPTDALRCGLVDVISDLDSALGLFFRPATLAADLSISQDVLRSVKGIRELEAATDLVQRYQRLQSEGLRVNTEQLFVDLKKILADVDSLLLRMELQASTTASLDADRLTDFFCISTAPCIGYISSFAQLDRNSRPLASLLATRGAPAVKEVREKLVENTIDGTDRYLILAVVYYIEGQFEFARQEIRKVPEDSSNRKLMLACFAENAGEFSDAEEILASLTAGDETGAVHLTLARVRLSRAEVENNPGLLTGAADSAMSAYKKCTLHSYQAEALCLLAEAYLRGARIGESPDSLATKIRGIEPMELPSQLRARLNSAGRRLSLGDRTDH